MKSKIFLPFIPCGGSKPQSRQKFIKMVQNFIIKNKLNEIYFQSGNKLKAMVYFHYISGANIKDIDNSLKGLLDALKGYLFFDDNQIKDIHAKIIEDSKHNGVEVRLFKIK